LADGGCCECYNILALVSMLTVYLKCCSFDEISVYLQHLFDRVMRISRLGVLNLSKFQATIRYNKDVDIIHLRVPVHGIPRPRAGSYYCSYSVNGLEFWESHPFTLMSWNEVGAKPAKDAALKLRFLVHPNDGFTVRLRDHVSEKIYTHTEMGTPEVSIRIAVEGAYGHTFKISDYQNVLMIMGGTGVTVALSHLCMICDIAIVNEKPSTSIRRVQLVWVVHDSYMFEEVYESELLPLWTLDIFSGERQFKIHVNVVENRSTTPSIKDDKGPKMKTFSSEFAKEGHADDTGKSWARSHTKYYTISSPKVTLVREIPSLQRLVQERAEKWHANEQNMAVICCGLGSMMGEV
jgi:hypothetical protein